MLWSRDLYFAAIILTLVPSYTQQDSSEEISPIGVPIRQRVNNPRSRSQPSCPTCKMGGSVLQNPPVNTNPIRQTYQNKGNRVAGGVLSSLLLKNVHGTKYGITEPVRARGKALNVETSTIFGGPLATEIPDKTYKKEINIPEEIKEPLVIDPNAEKILLVSTFPPVYNIEGFQGNRYVVPVLQFESPHGYTEDDDSEEDEAPAEQGVNAGDDSDCDDSDDDSDSSDCKNMRPPTGPMLGGTGDEQDAGGTGDGGGSDDVDDDDDDRDGTPNPMACRTNKYSFPPRHSLTNITQCTKMTINGKCQCKTPPPCLNFEFLDWYVAPPARLEKERMGVSSVVGAPHLNRNFGITVNCAEWILIITQILYRVFIR